MRRSLLPLLLLAFLVTAMVSGVWATWVYLVEATPDTGNAAVSLGNIHYGTLYITKVETAEPRAAVAKTADTNISISLDSPTPKLTVKVTFYNSTEVSYYYKETTALSWSNNAVKYTVTGLNQTDEVPARSWVTLTVEIPAANADLLGELHFNFVVDKDSIGTVVAMTAVDRFRDILNNVAAPDSYQQLDNGMNSQTGYNKAHAVTYIGNVVGSSSDDSALIEGLFGEEFISMDLDGNGKTEPITMMIKRLDLDENSDTGGSYTYTSGNRYYTETGIEMTLYITSTDLDSVRKGAEVEVYAATFTILPGESQWVQVVPLTKGTATTNSYSGSLFGGADSFNTDTWKSEPGNKTISQLMKENMS